MAPKKKKGQQKYGKRSRHVKNYPTKKQCPQLRCPIPQVKLGRQRNPSNEDLLDCLTNHGAYHCTIQARHDESQGKACLTSVGHDHRDRHHSTKAVAHHGSLQPHPAKEKAENHGQSASKYEEFVRWIASWARNLR